MVLDQVIREVVVGASLSLKVSGTPVASYSVCTS